MGAVVPESFLSDNVPPLPTKLMSFEASSLLDPPTKGYPEAFVVEDTGKLVP